MGNTLRQGQPSYTTHSHQCQRCLRKMSHSSPEQLPLLGLRAGFVNTSMLQAIEFAFNYRVTSPGSPTLAS